MLLLLWNNFSPVNLLAKYSYELQLEVQHPT